MTKPIFIVRIPFSINKDKLKEQMDYVTRKLHDDYHVIPVLDNYVQQLQFECYNPNNISDKKLEEIKQMVLNQLKNEQ
jgi:HD-like signal output (HDOD) protein